MDNVVQGFLERATWVMRCAWRRRWLAVSVALVVALLCGAGIWFVPNRYEASARIYVDTQTVLKPLMAGLTFQPDIDQQVGMLARTLISRPNVERLVETPDLKLEIADPAVREEVVARLMARIKVAPAGSGNMYEISYRDASPTRARRLVEAIIDLFVNSGVGAKKRDSEDAGRFIEDQIRSYEGKLIAAENRLKDFKVRNFGVSGVSNQDYFTRMSSLSDEVDKLRTALGAAERTRDAYQHQLNSEEPQLPAELAPKTSSSPLVAEIDARLETQRKQLDELLRRFTEEHPDVVSARRIIQQLEVESQHRKAAEAHALASLGKPGRAATSPIYQRIRIALSETDAQVASLRSQLATQQARLEQVRSVAGRAPQAEAELAQLNRDYEIIRKNYDLMVARRESASLGVKLDESSQLAEFRTIEPPRVSKSPVFPSRLHLATIALVLAVAAGLFATVLADIVRPTIDEVKSLQLLSRRPVLGTISMLVTEEAKRGVRANAIGFGFAVAALFALQATWLAWVALKSPIN